MNSLKEKFLIAGIGAGSLGLELLKCFKLSDCILIYGADIDKNAYGHFDQRFVKTFTIDALDKESYCKSIINICKKYDIQFVVPGAEATNSIITMYQEDFKDNGIFPYVNSKKVYDICSDKVKCNNFLREQGLPYLETLYISNIRDLDSFSSFPCIIKPAKDSGGSNLVFLAENLKEAQFFVNYLETRGVVACVQEYIDSSFEFTVGVLSNPNGEVLSSIALQRNLTSKLSRSLAYGNRIISSGWSQGRIENFSFICKQAENIAKNLKSTWAINIQGRLRNQEFIPFEINPRHSGTSYFRALSGVNEVLIGLNYLKKGENNFHKNIKIKEATFYRILKEEVVYDGEQNR
jgi:carbamoyl-phosphate synthase large subunit